MYWVLLLALSNGETAIIPAADMQSCENTRTLYANAGGNGVGLPMIDGVSSGIEWSVCSVRGIEES